MKEINVVAAIIKIDNKFLVTARSKGEFKGMYEFPGGKIEENESKEQALIREIKEELNGKLVVEYELCNTTYQYESFKLNMTSFLCSLEDNYFELLEHETYKIVDLEELEVINFLPADVEVVDYLKDFYNK